VRVHESLRKEVQGSTISSRHFSTAFANHHSFQPLPLDSREFGRVAANPSFMRIRLNHLRWHWTYSVSTESYSWLIAYTSVTFRETMFLEKFD